MDFGYVGGGVKKMEMKQSEWVKHMPPWHWPYMLGTLWCRCFWEVQLGYGTNCMLNKV